MRILQMTYQGDVGGSTNSISWLTAGLAGRGHDVWLASRPESLIASRFQSGPVHRVDATFPRGPRLLAEATRWKRWIDEQAIDVVNAHASLDRRLLSYVKLLGTRARVVHTRRNVPLSSGGRARAWFDTMTTDTIIAVSSQVATDLVRRGIPNDHVATVLNGLPLDRLAIPDPARVAALRRKLTLRDRVPCVGVVARRKSQDDLLRAAARMARPLDILMAGTDWDDELRGLAARLPAEVQAHCLGFRDDVADLSALFDVFVLPSSIEGFSLALIEAMARGLPCVASDAGGNREALAEGAGRIVPPGDVDALVRALTPLLDDPAGARALGERAKERAHAHFHVSRTVENTEAVYAKLVGAGGGKVAQSVAPV